MMKEMKNKLMPILVTAILLLSLVPIVLGNGTTLRVQYDRTSVLTVWGDSINTPGDEITVRVTDGSLTPDQTYTLTVNNTDTGDWGKLYKGSGKADSKGDISFATRVPGYSLLGSGVIDTHTLDLWEGDPDDGICVASTTIDIHNYFKVKIFVDDQEVSHLYHNYTYFDNELEFRIYNYTGGTSYELADDIEVSCYLYEPDGSDTNTSQFDITDEDDGVFNEVDEFEFDFIDADGNMETFYWVYVENNDDGNQYSTAAIPIKFYFNTEITGFDLEETYPWADEDIEIDVYFQEYLWDDGDEVNELQKAASYGSRVSIFGQDYDGVYYEVDYDLDAASKGKFSLSFNPVVDDWPAGTYYLGTYFPGGAEYRINETYNLNIPNFIEYASFEVTPVTSAVITVVDPDEIISDFNQTINVSINNMWDDDNYLNEDMYLHFTGLECWYDGTLYEEDDVVVLGDNGSLGTKWTESKVYYEFIITFKETGTGTFMVTWPYSDDIYSDNDLLEPDYFEFDMVADITGEKTFSVVAPDNINVVIVNYPEEVLVDDWTGAWVNYTGATTVIYVYGDSEDEPMNASIEIEGCGVTKTIAEDEDEVNLDAGYKFDDGVYKIDLQPKRKGTLSFTITNDTEGYTATKDYTIAGLDGIVTTSDGDDLEITVGEPETITLDMSAVYSFADVEVGLFDYEWNEVDTINQTEGDEDEPGAGEDGNFEFILEEDDVENVGFIVVAAVLNERYCYDVIEIVPDHDLEINVSDPSEDNYIFTVGIPTTIVITVLDPNGDVAEDIDSGDVIGEILNSEGDVLQTVEFDENGDDWEIIEEILWFPGTLVITATNNTGAAEHDGNITFEVDLATITYTPDTITCGIELEDIEITVTGKDAFGDPLTEIGLVLNEFNASDGLDDMMVDLDDNSITLDEDGTATVTVECTGNRAGKVNATFEGVYVEGLGNNTYGQLTIAYPYFEISPSIISSELRSATVIVTATDGEGLPIAGLNITFNNTFGNCIEQPTPEMTDENGEAVFTIVPLSSGKANVTIIHGLEWNEDGTYDWDEFVFTTSVLTVTRQTMDITLSATKVYAGQTFTVTVKDDGTPVKDADVTFDGTTTPTNANGVATFTAGNPGVESYQYTINIVKDGYPDATATVLVINTYQIKMTVSPAKPVTGQSFTVTVVANTRALAGATVTFEGVEVTSDNDGKATFTAPTVDKDTDYTVTATYPDDQYEDGTLPITVVKGTPGFELLTLIVAIGVAFILLRRRKHN